MFKFEFFQTGAKMVAFFVIFLSIGMGIYRFPIGLAAGWFLSLLLLG
jgi:hypothetical protein